MIDIDERSIPFLINHFCIFKGQLHVHPQKNNLVKNMNLLLPNNVSDILKIKIFDALVTL